MAKAPKNSSEQKTRQPILTYLIIFIVGFLTGVGFSAFKLDSGGSSAVSQSASQQQTSQQATAIQSLEAEVTAHPENFQAWVQLGHLYFDSQQHEKAIEAYTTSLKYHSGDANLLTDLGVMYRRTGKPEKALEYFEKAQTMDPSHITSRLNEGIVRHYDLGDTAGAVASWEEVLKINPNAMIGSGESLQDFVSDIKKQAGLEQNQ